MGLNLSLVLTPAIPQVSSLKSRLKKVSTTTGDGVARAFLKTQAALFGSYRNALQIESVSAAVELPLMPSCGLIAQWQKQWLLGTGSGGCNMLKPFSDSHCVSFQGEPITFNEETFVNHRSSAMRQFLQNAIQLQLFKQVHMLSSSSSSMCLLSSP